MEPGCITLSVRLDRDLQNVLRVTLETAVVLNPINQTTVRQSARRL